MQQFNRVILLVLDSVGVGELPDADKYGDKGANTVANIAKKVGGLKLPNLQMMGLGNITDIKGVSPNNKTSAYYGKMAEASIGKDTITGHWEIAGLHIEHPFNTYPNGFPDEIINIFIEQTGVGGVLANKPASGTEIIEQFGEKHLETGWPIVYTSADSVFQIAAHEEVIPIDKLYEICQTAREILQGEYNVGRVIARPFIGEVGNFKRTTNRKDYSVTPPKPTILDKLTQADIPVIAIGKISDIFSGRGISASYKTTSNRHGLETLNKQLQELDKGLIFVNLIDFDMLYGHRNDPYGYAKALEEIDCLIPELLNNLAKTDLLIITADHGCDPTMDSTDHTREYTPLIVYHHQITAGNDLGIRSTFADIAATMADNFNIKNISNGKSFLKDII